MQTCDSMRTLNYNTVIVFVSANKYSSQTNDAKLLRQLCSIARPLARGQFFTEIL